MAVHLVYAVFSVVATLALSSALAPPSYRLPGDVMPHHYTLSVFTDLDHSVFNGTVDIRFECKTPTDIVKLHSSGLVIEERTVFIEKNGRNEHLSLVKLEYDTKNEFLIINLANKLEAQSKYLLHISFNGKLSNTLHGYYKSSYVDETSKTTKWLSATQFEPTYARRAFPCFDEPAMKAYFTIRLGHRRSLSALSNMPLSTSLEVDGVVWDTFKESVKMSTYLVAYILSEFEYKESDPEANRVTFRVWARRNVLDELEFARKHGPNFLEYYEKLFRLDFPLQEQDMVAIPDFAEAAMENLGLITFNEASLLVENKNPSQLIMERVATTIAHELAHQWFGNLVTIKWWTDLWLSEGFATYMAHLALRDQFPEWNSYNIGIAYNFLNVLNLDALVTSHPVSPHSGEPDVIIQYFDKLSYDKGSLLIRMMRSYLGEDVFRNGVSAYLNKLIYSNAEQDDLWESLTIEAKGRNVLPKGVTVKEVMDKWTKQSGYPVVTVNREGGTIKVSQKRFLAIPKKSVQKLENSWWIPLTFSTAKYPNFEHTKSSHWLCCDASELTIDTGADSDDWIILNNKGSGLYRVNYDNVSWQLIADTLKGPRVLEIHELNRMLLIADAMYLAKANLLDYRTAIQVFSYIQKEKSYVPWMAAFDALGALQDLLWRTEKYIHFKTFVQTILTDIYEKYSDLSSLPKNYSDVRLKTSVISWSCKYNVGHCVEDAAKLFKNWMSTGTNKIIEDLRSVVYCEGVKQGGDTEWNFLWEQFRRTNDPNEKIRIIKGLSCTKRTELLKRYLESPLDESNGIRKQDAFFVFIYTAKNSQLGFELSTRFLYDNLQRLYDFYSPHTTRLDKYFSVILDRLVYRKEIDAIRYFIAANTKMLTRLQLTVNQGLESAESNLAWLKAFYDNISLAFQFHNKNRTVDLK